MVTVYSRRLDWSAPPSAISEVWRKRRALGEATIDLTLSNPTQAGFEYPQSTILKSLGSPGSLTYTPDPSGLAAAR